MENFYFSDYEKITDASIVALIDQLNQKLQAGAHSIQVYGDKTNNKDATLVFEKQPNGNYIVKNYVGVLSFQSDDYKVYNFTIGSRFDKSDPSQQFLSYMLRNSNRSTAVVFNEVVVKVGRAPILQQVLLFKFIELMKKAHKKGIFKQYITNHYNNSKIKGTIDINQHIKYNMLANGKVAYKVTERQVLNPMNVLILQAFDHLTKKYPQTMQNCMNQLSSVRDFIGQLKAQIPDYATHDVFKVTAKQIVHPYYSIIEELRKTARDILRNRGVEIFEQSNHKVQGIMLNINKLWEWFLEEMIFNKLPVDGVTSELSNGFKKPILMNSTKKEDALATVIPDFTILQKSVPIAVFDAKHRVSWQASVTENERVKYIREDVFQVLAYMEVLNCSVGGVVFPYSKNEDLLIDDVENRMVSDNKSKHVFIPVPYVVKPKGDQFEQLMDEQNEQIRYRIANEIETALENEAGMKQAFLNELLTFQSKGATEQQLADFIKRLRSV